MPAAVRTRQISKRRDGRHPAGQLGRGRHRNNDILLGPLINLREFDAIARLTSLYVLRGSLDATWSGVAEPNTRVRLRRVSYVYLFHFFLAFICSFFWESLPQLASRLKYHQSSLAFLQANNERISIRITYLYQFVCSGSGAFTHAVELKYLFAHKSSLVE